MICSRAVFVALAFLLLPFQAEAVPGYAYSRDLNVPAPGWVRVPLDLAALRHMAPGGVDLRVLSPGGAPLPFKLSAAMPGSGRLAVEIREPEREDAGEAEGGWVQILVAGGGEGGGDVGGSHERLILDLPLDGRAPRLSLEGSADGVDWQPLTAGVPSRLDGVEGLARLALAYPSTTDRFLRLHWPSSPVPLKLAAAEVETVAGPTLALAARGARCNRAQARAICTLELPAGQIVRRISVELEGAGPVGYRLSEPRDARWEPLASGIWQRTPGEGRSGHVVAGSPRPLAGSQLLLELFAPAGQTPSLVGYVLDLAVPTVLFRAEQPGLHTLAYGGLSQTASTALARPGAGALWIEPGLERESPPPPLPGGLGAQLGNVRFSSTWTLAAPGVEPGDLVRLELPAVVYTTAREDLGDLRLAIAGRQIPFYRWTPPAPTLAFAERELAPTESERPGESRVVLALPAENLPLTQLDLTAPGAPLRRPVSVIYVDPGKRSPRSGRAAREPVAKSTWECAPEAPLPCRERLALRGIAPRLLTVRFRDGDNPRLSAVDAAIWRRRDLLLFVWPKEAKGGKDGEVRLLAGASALETPRYDLAEVGPALLGRAWEPVEIRSAGEAQELPWWNRWVMPLAVAGATIWLLILLRRILAEA